MLNQKQQPIKVNKLADYLSTVNRFTNTCITPTHKLKMPKTAH